MKNVIYEILKNAYKSYSVKELEEILNIKTSEEFKELIKALNELEDEYLIYHNKKNHYGLLSVFDLVIGTIDVKEAGFGFIRVNDENFKADFANYDFTEDIYISQNNRNSALANDLVLVRCFENYNRVEGVVEKIIKRNKTEIVGILNKVYKKYYLESIEPKTKLEIHIPKEYLNNAKSNQLVKAKITKYYPNTPNLLKAVGEGKIIKIYGEYDDPGMDILALIESSGISQSFKNDVLKEVHNISQEVDFNLLKDRTDLTNKLIVTIDGDDAKDLDDAIHVSKLANGNYLLGVYIADVSEYVKDNTNLDIEAYNRGTSIYLIDRVIPMLPKELSNGICSLNEGVIRLVLACEMEIDLKGEIVNSKIFKGYIKSKARLTYNIVNEILENNNQKYRDFYASLVEMLENARDLAKILYNMRVRRGAFEFETLESKVILDENLKAVDIVLRTRKTSEKLIEEFMLIANECVATTMKWLDVPFIYRVHDKPKEEKLDRFIQYANMLNFKIDTRNDLALAKSLQKLFLSIKDDDEVTSRVISTMLLRSMSKAVYQTNNIGHYGLASKCYTHFTSPIRRYPDLVVHRLIKQFLLNENQIDEKLDPLTYFSRYTYDASSISSKRERLAETIERNATDMKKAEYMIKHIGEKYVGRISSVTNFGCFVVLDNTIEGLVRFENLPDDYYDVNEKLGILYGMRTDRVFSIGEAVLVKVLSVNKKQNQINLQILKKVEK